MARMKSTYGTNGVIIFDNLWNILRDKGYNKKWLVEQKISPTLINKLRKNENVSCELIVKICNLLDCQPCDFMEYARKDGSKPKAITSRQSETAQEPPKQAHIAMKTAQADILPSVAENKPKTDKIKAKSVTVEVKGENVELWLDQFDGVFDTTDIEQLEAFRAWKSAQMPEITREEPEEAEEPRQKEVSGLTAFDEAIKEVLTRDREPKRTELEEMHFQADKIMRSTPTPVDDYKRFPQTDIKEFKEYLKDRKTEEFKEYLTEDYKYNFQAKAGYVNFERFMSAVVDELEKRIKEESN